MALGEYSPKIGWTGSSSASITYVCPECQAGNVTQAIAAGMAPDVSPTIYARVTCAACGHDMLVTITYPVALVAVQEVS